MVENTQVEQKSHLKIKMTSKSSQKVIISRSQDDII